MMLGDRVAGALDMAGVTHEAVARWLGAECGCKERQDKLNALGAWAERVARGKVERAGEFLRRMMQ